MTKKIAGGRLFYQFFSCHHRWNVLNRHSSSSAHTQQLIYVVIYSSYVQQIEICKREFHSLRLNRGTRSVYDHDLLQRSGSLPESKMLSCAAVCNDVSVNVEIHHRAVYEDGWMDFDHLFLLPCLFPVFGSRRREKKKREIKNCDETAPTGSPI